MKKVFFLFFFFASWALVAQTSGASGDTTIHQSHIVRITIGNETLEAGYKTLPGKHENNYVCRTETACVIKYVNRDDEIIHLGIPDFEISSPFYEQSVWEILAGYCYYDTQFNWSWNHDAGEDDTNEYGRNIVLQFPKYIVKMYKNARDEGNIIYNETLNTTAFTDHSLGLTDYNGASMSLRANDLRVPISAGLRTAISMAKTVILELIPVDNAGKTYKSALLTMFKKGSIVKIEEVTNSTVIHTKDNIYISADDPQRVVYLENCAPNRLDLYLDNTPEIISARIGATELTTAVAGNKLSISLPEGVYYTGNDEIDIRTEVDSKIIRYRFRLEFGSSNPFRDMKAQTAFAIQEKESCADILFTLDVQNGGEVTSCAFATPSTYVGGLDYYSAVNEIRLTPLYEYCRYNEITHTLSGDYALKPPQLTLSAETYCQHDIGIKLELSNSYNRNIEIFAEVNSVPQAVAHDTFFKTGTGQHKVKFYAQANHLTGCKAYTDQIYVITEYPAPMLPHLDGLLYDCGNGATLTHNNPEYGTQYWLYDDSNNLIKHKGANFWLFRNDQYDHREGNVPPEAHKVMDLRAGTYKIVATHDKNTCTSTFPFTIIDQEVLSPLPGAILRCQSNENYNLFNLFEPGTLRDNIEQGAEGITYRFAVTDGYTAVPVIGTKFVNTAALTANKDYSVSLTIIAANGCSKIVERDFTVIPRPDAFTIASAANNLLCNGEDWPLSVTAPQSGVTYTWYVDDAEKGAGNTYLSGALASGNHSAYAVGRNAAGCEITSNTLSVAVNRVTNTAALKAELVELCQSEREVDLFDYLIGSAADIADLKVKNGVNYHFSFSDGGPVIYGPTGSKIDLSAVQANPNPYTLTLTVSQNGCTKIYTKQVFIKARPAAFTIASNINEESENICDGLAWNLHVGQPQSGVTYTWFLDGAQSSEGINYSAHSLFSGLHQAYALGRNAAGCETRSNTETATARYFGNNARLDRTLVTLCQAERELDLFDYLVGSAADIADLKAKNGINYTFSFSAGGPAIYGSGLHTINLSNQSIVSSNPHILTLTLSQNGCERTFTKEILIKAQPSAFTITGAAGNLLCNDESWPLSVTTPQSGVTYTWYVDDAEKGAGSTYSSGTLTTGNHSAYAVGHNAEGCAIISNTLSVAVNRVTNTAALNPDLVELCQADRELDLFDYLIGGATDIADLKARNGVNYNFSFSNGGPAIYGATNSKINLSTAPANVNPYLLTLTVSQNNCTKIYTKEVLIKARPAAFTIITDDATVCNTPVITLSANNVSAGATLKWYADGALFGTGVPGGTTANHSRNGDNTTVYSAVADLAGCTLAGSNTVSVERKTVDFSGVVFDPAPVSFCQTDGRVELFDYVSGSDKNDVQYLYDGWGRDFSATPDGLVLDGPQIVLSSSVATGATPYTVTFRVHKDGCYMSFTKTVSIRQRPNEPALSTNANNLCEGEKATLTATGGATNYEWYKDGVMVDSGSSQYVHVETGTQSITEYYAVGVTDLTASACRSQASQPVTIASNAPLGEFSMSKSCYSGAERPVIITTDLSNIRSIAVKATPAGNGSAVAVPLNGYTFGYPLMLETWDLSATVTSTNDCRKVVNLGTINVSNACPTSMPVGPYHITAITECPDCPDCEEIRLINNELDDIYRNYLQQWKSRSQYKALLSPTVTANGEQLTVNIYVTGIPGTVQIHMIDIAGAVFGVKSARIHEGENKVDISDIIRPSGQIYMLRIIYPDGSYEILKGLTN